MSKWKVLIIEDDREMRQSLIDLIHANGWSAVAFSRASDALKEIEALRADVILSDVQMPGLSGLELLHKLPVHAPPVVLISAHGDIQMAVDAMQKGAYSFVEKPYEPRRLLSILDHAAEQNHMRASNVRLRDRLKALSGLDRILIGKSDAMSSLRDEIENVVDSKCSIFIHGETGTGKDLVARALHDLSPVSDEAFLPLNCAGLTPKQLHDGLIGLGDGGTIYLDEVCACPADVQAMLLRVIEDNELVTDMAVGPRKITARFISATIEEPQKAMNNSLIRQDLFYRLNAATFYLPPMRQRQDDLVLLMAHFLMQSAKGQNMRAPTMSQEDIAAILAYSWPGNGREMRNVAERLMLMKRRGVGTIAEAISQSNAPTGIPSTLREAVAVFERELIGKAIGDHSGRMEDVAAALGIGRRTLNEKIVKLDLDKDAFL